MLSVSLIQKASLFQNPVIIAGTPSHNGDEEAAVRIRGIDTAAKTFNLYLDIPNHGYGQGAICGGDSHAHEEFSWLIVEAGNYLEGGLQADADTYGQCSGGSLCVAPACPSCDHSTGFDWLDVAFARECLRTAPAPR